MYVRHALNWGLPQPLINFAPSSEGTGGGEDDGADDFIGDEDFESGDEDLNEDEDLEFEDSDGEGDDEPQLDANGNPIRKKKKLSRDKGDFLSQFWGADEKDEDEDDPDADAGDSKEAREALTAKVAAAINAIDLAEDFIPDDFDPNDSKQLRGVLKKALQRGASATLQAAFIPMQAALTQQAVRLRQEMKAMLGEGISNNSVQSQLTRRVPASANPENRQVVKLVMKQAKERFPGDARKQTLSAIKALAGLGITSASASKNRPNGAVREKSSGSVLDAFAPMPKRGNQADSRAQGRMRRGG